MPRNFKLPKLNLKGVSVSDPRVVMRAVIGALLLVNLAAAVVAFKPFGGSADDMRREEASLVGRLTSLQGRVNTARQLAGKVEIARREGDQFMGQYIIDARVLSSTLAEELNGMAKQAGIRPLPQQMQPEPIEGSDTLQMVRITAGYEGSYANFRKFVELLDKSPRLLIIENIVAQSPQQLQQAGQVVNMSLTLDAFVRDAQGVQP